MTVLAIVFRSLIKPEGFKRCYRGDGGIPVFSPPSEYFDSLNKLQLENIGSQIFSSLKDTIICMFITRN